MNFDKRDFRKLPKYINYIIFFKLKNKFNMVTLNLTLLIKVINKNVKSNYNN